jgi:hypothetical protein
MLKSALKGIYKCLRGIFKILPIPRSSRASLKKLVTDAAVYVYASNTGKYVPELLVRLSQQEEELSVARRYIDGILQAGYKSDEFADYKENYISFDDDDVKPIAFYLTQFRPIPENDEWWGKGFTEWTNVTKSMPLFSGHYQPHLPLETFYDLTNVDAMKKQVSLAKNYGIYGFCFHYYWFSGKRLLEKPLENYFSTKEGLDFPFCINWANHSWTRVWDASEDDVLIEQKHSEKDDLACIADICRYISDERYIRVNGKPLISIFNPAFLPDTNKTIRTWRDYCRQNGFGEIHLIGIDHNLWNPLIYDFDGAIASSPNDIGQFYNDLHTIKSAIDCKSSYILYDMEKYVREKRYLKDGREKLYRGIIPTFDNSPRRRDAPCVLSVSPALYKEWLYDILQDSKRNFESGNRYVFINAWNEWAEGAHLEPDRKYGYAYLQATADAVLESKDD